MQIEYKGYTVSQYDNKHVIVSKDGVSLIRASVDRIMDEEGLRSIVDDMISADEAIQKMRADHAAKTKQRDASLENFGTVIKNAMAKDTPNVPRSLLKDRIFPSNASQYSRLSQSDIDALTENAAKIADSEIKHGKKDGDGNGA